MEQKGTLPEGRVVTITPAIATKLLEHAAKNRKLKKNKIAQYARDMVAGHWQLNGETIVIGSDGKLLDGQHRLLACIESGVPFKTLLVEGVDPEAFKTMNSGASRTAADMLGLAGCDHYAREIASSAAIVFQHEHKLFRAKVMPTKEEVLDVLSAYPELPDCVSATHPGRRILPMAMLGAIRCLGARKFDEDTAELFIQSVIDGVNLGATSPVKLLRDQMMQETRTRGQRLIREAALATCIKAFNGFAWQIPMTKNDLIWKKGEPMPYIGDPPSKKLRNRRMTKMNGGGVHTHV